MKKDTHTPKRFQNHSWVAMNKKRLETQAVNDLVAEMRQKYIAALTKIVQACNRAEAVLRS